MASIDSQDRVSLKDLAVRLLEDSALLLRELTNLAAAEGRSRLSQLRVAALLLAAAGASLLVGLVMAATAAVTALAHAMPPWAAALSVAAILLAAGVVLSALFAASLRRAGHSASPTVAAVKEGVRSLRAGPDR